MVYTVLSIKFFWKIFSIYLSGVYCFIMCCSFFIKKIPEKIFSIYLSNVFLYIVIFIICFYVHFYILVFVYGYIVLFIIFEFCIILFILLCSKKILEKNFRICIYKVIIFMLFNYYFRDIIGECLYDYLCDNLLLVENSVDRRVNGLLRSYYRTDDFSKIRSYRASFLNRLPNARSRHSKWLYTVLSWYLNGDIPSFELLRLNKFLGWLNFNECSDSVVNDSDWSSLDFSYIKRIYDDMFPISSNVSSDIVSDKVVSVNGFTIRRLDSQDEAYRFGSSVYDGEWCIFNRGGFDEQVDGCTCYVISNDSVYSSSSPMSIVDIVSRLDDLGEFSVSDKIRSLSKSRKFDIIGLTESCEEYFDVACFGSGLPPYDDYGLSAIVVLVGDGGELYGVYSRYNLPNMFDGQLFDKSGLSSILGVDIDSVCPYVE